MLRRPRVAIFDDIIKIITIFIKPRKHENTKSLKTRKQFRKLEIMHLYLNFLIQQNLLISSEKMLMSAELKGCTT